MGKRGIFECKRAVAHEVLIEAMQAVVAVLVLVATLSFVGNELEKVGFAKRFYARDMGLLATTLHSAPGNLFYLYDIKTVDEKQPDKYRFDLLIQNNTVRINASNSPKSVYYWYFSDIWLKGIDYSETGRLGIVRFVKEGDMIKIGLSVMSNANVLLCPSVNTYDASWYDNKLIIEPGHGESARDSGAVSQSDTSFTEEEVALLVSQSDGFKKLKVGENRLLTRGQTSGDRYVPLDKRAEFVAKNAGPASLILALHTGNSADSANYIKAYYNINSADSARIKSRKLGCSILNSILRKENLKGGDSIDGVAVIPSDSEYINKIIPPGKIGVMLELGNMQIPKQDNFLAYNSQLAEAIYVGIEDYNSK